MSLVSTLLMNVDKKWWIKIEYLCPTFTVHIDFPPGQWPVLWCRYSTCMHAAEAFALNLQRYSSHTFFCCTVCCFSQQMLSKEISNDQSKTPIMVHSCACSVMKLWTCLAKARIQRDVFTYLLTYRPLLLRWLECTRLLVENSWYVFIKEFLKSNTSYTVFVGSLVLWSLCSTATFSPSARKFHCTTPSVKFVYNWLDFCVGTVVWFCLKWKIVCRLGLDNKGKNKMLPSDELSIELKFQQGTALVWYTWAQHQVRRGSWWSWSSPV